MRKWLQLTLLFIFLFTLAACNDSNKVQPSNFGFSLKYGVGANNELNTFNQIFTKDMVKDPNITIDFQLNKDQIEIIYHKMMDIDILDYPENYYPQYGLILKRHISPAATYILKVRIGDQTKVITWLDDQDSQKEKAIKLRELLHSIIDMVEKTEEYKKLPAPKALYF